MLRKTHRHLSFVIITGLILGFVLILGALAGPAAAGDPGATSPDGVWAEIAEAAIPVGGERLIVPSRYRTLRLDAQALEAVLASAAEPRVLSLPLPGGGFGRFAIAPAPVMAPELAAKFPQIRTYAGRSLDEPGVLVRLDWTPHGFHALLLSPAGTGYIDPYRRGDTQHYLSYWRADYRRTTDFVQHEPLGDAAAIEALLAALGGGAGLLPSGDELRTYRLAMAATGEYTQYHGGTVADALAEIVTAMNRVNGIYERDVAVRMELIANNDQIIYTNPATDPYTNNNGSTMLGQNQANLDAVIGSANYDIGHVFSTGGGGIAWLGAVCQAGIKARGVTGLSNPVGDPFYVDYVAHEIGHQYGANHTFNGTAGSCSGGNRNASTAYEPGSGTTIMAYAGICGSQNIQLNSDDHFHSASIDEMRAYTTAGAGDSCAVTTATGNSAPLVAAGSDYTIPLNTPFRLTGSASDPDGDSLSYNWEQFDLGPAGHPNNPSGNAPLFRSFPSVSTPVRTFPQISDLVNNTQTIGELLPTYARGLSFRLTVRDNQVAPSAGGVDFDSVSITVAGGAGPFLVSAPNTNVTWETGTLETVSWDVANTDQPPVNCAAVDIRLSTDGGFTYPVLIAAGTANDGAQSVVVPNEVTSTARVQVACADNIFFDISNTNFTIEQGPPVAILSVGKLVQPAGLVDPGQPLTYTVTVSNTGIVTATATITDTFPAGLVGAECEGVPGDLNVVASIAPAGQASYECTVQVDPGLDIELSKTVDRDVVNAGESVTYTLAVTNPHGTLTLANVLVSDPLVGSCTPALGVPFDLGPGASQTFVCPDVAITQTVTNTASATAEFQIDNQAQASAPEDPFGIATSGVVSSPVGLAAEASLTVTANPQLVYKVYLPLSVRSD